MKPHILLIGYKKRSGKDTVANLIAAEFTRLTGRASCILHFAQAIKNDTCRLFQITPEFLDSNKEVYRPFLQWYGTEYMRKFMNNDNYWSAKTCEIAKKSEASLVIIPDFRFKCEYEYTIEQFGESRVKTLRVMTDTKGKLDLHASENELVSFAFDQHIANVGDLQQLKEQVDIYCNDSTWFQNMVENLNNH